MRAALLDFSGRAKAARGSAAVACSSGVPALPLLRHERAVAQLQEVEKFAQPRLLMAD
jgi:hypothetical protein